MGKHLSALIRNGAFTGLPALITEDVLKALKDDIYKLIEQAAVVIFLGHSHLTFRPSLVFPGDVYLYNCVLADAHGVKVKGSVTYINTTKLSSFGEVGCLEIYDDVSMARYVSARGKGLILDTSASKTLKPAQALTENLLSLVKCTPKIDLLSYVNGIHGTDLKITPTGYSIDNGIALYGPYQFSIPDNLTIRTELLFLDYVYQTWPPSMKIDGPIEIRTDFGIS